MPQEFPLPGAVVVVVPARWGSTRFPGKPLHDIAGKPLVRHVWERCQQCSGVDEVIIATDDERIQKACSSFGAHVVLTSPDHPSGTDRVAEAVENRPGIAGVINVQGDEPLISPSLIDEMASLLRSADDFEMITAASPMVDEQLIPNPNVVKVVCNLAGNALYFSRSPLPFSRNALPDYPVLRHLGIYGYRPGFLREFVSWPPSPLEQIESLEQLRALEHGARIRVLITHETSPGVDTPEQAREVESILFSQTSP